MFKFYWRNLFCSIFGVLCLLKWDFVDRHYEAQKVIGYSCNTRCCFLESIQKFEFHRKKLFLPFLCPLESKFVYRLSNLRIAVEEPRKVLTAPFGVSCTPNPNLSTDFGVRQAVEFLSLSKLIHWFKVYWRNPLGCFWKRSCVLGLPAKPIVVLENLGRKIYT